jgi:hypothetical protein
MRVLKKLGGGLAVAALFYSGSVMAQMEGVYVSDAADGCTLTITEIDLDTPRFGDARFALSSRGVAACMWDGVGIASSTNLAGAYISLPPTHNRVFIYARWLFGLASPQIEITQRNAEGQVILQNTYTRQ